MYDTLICFSHLRWNFVFQRPQHLLKRFASAGQRVFYVEEPVYDASENAFYNIQEDEQTSVKVVLMHLPGGTQAAPEKYLKTLTDQLISDEQISNYITWYYAPMAFASTDHLTPDAIVYDCMDELSAFKFAPPQLRDMEKKLMQKADIVFTGGASLFEAKKHLHLNIHAFPSSIDKEHFAKARVTQPDPADQAGIPHPRFGFYGVIDERFDTRLLGELAGLRPNYHFIMLGPVVKIDPAELPQRDNIHYLGGKQYDELPIYLSGWDVAIMPFAINESTMFISPTKTPEFLAGGKPVISTAIRDVVAPYGTHGLVRIASTAEEFANDADVILSEGIKPVWLEEVDEFLADLSWDNTWRKMTELINKVLERKDIQSPSKQKEHV